MAARLANFGRNLGLAFQIADDLLDLVGDEATAGKTLGTDLEQQKLTLPVIHCLHRLPRAEADALRAAILRRRGRAGPARAGGAGEDAIAGLRPPQGRGVRPRRPPGTGVRAPRRVPHDPRIAVRLGHPPGEVSRTPLWATLRISVLSFRILTIVESPQVFPFAILAVDAQRLKQRIQIFRAGTELAFA